MGPDALFVTIQSELNFILVTVKKLVHLEDDVLLYFFSNNFYSLLEPFELILLRLNPGVHIAKLRVKLLKPVEIILSVFILLLYVSTYFLHEILDFDIELVELLFKSHGSCAT